jgi:hypothetical protein
MALLAIRDEELPRRIAFVSDKVFEPRWWQRLLRSGPQVGFVSSLMIAAAILAHGYMRLAPPPAATGLTAEQIEIRIQEEVAKRLPAAIEQAAARVEAAQNARFQKALSETEDRIEFRRKADVAAAEDNYYVLDRKLTQLLREPYTASLSTNPGVSQ